MSTSVPWLGLGSPSSPAVQEGQNLYLPGLAAEHLGHVQSEYPAGAAVAVDADAGLSCMSVSEFRPTGSDVLLFLLAGSSSS